MNGTNGTPGTSARQKARNEATPSAAGWALSCPKNALSVEPLMPALVTSMPAAVETISAGICDTRPSPTVRRVKVWVASVKLSPFCATPMKMPAMTLMPVMMMPATASPRTNFEAPSIAP